LAILEITFSKPNYINQNNYTNCYLYCIYWSTRAMEWWV